MAQAPLLRPTPASRPRHWSPTQERLLDAAERLFAERGFAGTSMRAVTQAAGTSVSAANYHFGSKEELLRATLERRVAPMNARRLETIDALEAEAAGAPLPLEAILDAFLRPVFEVRDTRSHARFVAARLYSDPPELVSSLKADLFGEVSDRFLDALARVFPERSRAEIGLRFQLAIGAMVHVMSGHLHDAPHLAELFDAASGGNPDLLSDESVLRHMIAFIAAGLRAPVGEP